MDTFQDGGFDVPDPTDWLGTPLQGLMQVEQTLRCHVCKDFYNSPMITSCNHTFCSLCIRRCLSVDGKCPLCRANDMESKLRGNWALREAVDAFVKSRDSAMRFAKAPAPVATPNSPKRKATYLEDLDGDGQDTKRPRMSSRINKAKGAEATAAIMREEVDHVADDDRAFEPEPDDGLVACPICWTRMKSWQVDKHLDTSCPGTPQPQPPAASSSRTFSSVNGFTSSRATSHSSPKPSKAPDRLPTLAYSMLKDKDLRKKMTELGIPAHGTRQMLEKRHQEWITIWNANCDSANPKRRSELLNDLDVWERTMGSRAPSMSKAAVVGAQIKDKNFDAAAWAANHDSSFKDLIKNARKTRSQAQQKKQEPGPAEKPAAGEGAHGQQHQLAKMDQGRQQQAGSYQGEQQLQQHSPPPPPPSQHQQPTGSEIMNLTSILETPPRASNRTALTMEHQGEFPPLRGPNFGLPERQIPPNTNGGYGTQDLFNPFMRP